MMFQSHWNLRRFGCWYLYTWLPYWNIYFPGNVVYDAFSQFVYFFIKTWLRLLCKYPVTCIEAFLCNIYSYYCSNGENADSIIYTSICNNSKVNIGYFNFHYVLDNSLHKDFLILITEFLDIHICVWMFFAYRILHMGGVSVDNICID